MKKRKKVLIIVENLPVPLDTRVWLEANSLCKKGYEVIIICPKGKGYNKTYENINNIHIYRHPLPFEGKNMLGYLMEYSCALFFEFIYSLIILFKHGFDIIHACNPPDTIFLIGAFYKLLGKKFIFDHHDINPELYVAKFARKDIFYKVLLMLERLTYFFADVSIATNESFREIAIKRGKMSPEKVFVVRSFPNLDCFGSKTENEYELISNKNCKLECEANSNNTKVLTISKTQESHCIIENTLNNVSNLIQKINNEENFLYKILDLKKRDIKIVGYVGIIGNQECLNILIEAAKIISKKRNDLFYFVIGGGTELETIKKLAINSGVGNIFEFTGFLPHEKMIDLLQHADILVCPDEANEMSSKSTMVKILEYMALGKPIVQFDLLENRYSAQESSLYAENGNINDFADKILLLADNPQLCKKMGKIGRERIEKELNWNMSERKLYEAYENV